MDQTTIHTYNKLAKEYDNETVDFWHKFPRSFIDKFADSVKGKILNIGSGPGRDALLLRDKGLNIVCMDASSEMIKMCQEKDFQSVLGDLLSIPFEDYSFDGVWAYTSLLHIKKADISKAILEIKRILKRDGFLALGLIEGDTEGYKESSGVNMPRWFAFYRKGEVENLLSQFGFEVVYFEQFQPRSKNYLNFIARKR